MANYQLTSQYHLNSHTSLIPWNSILVFTLNPNWSITNLHIIVGETVTLTRRIDKNWYEGKIGSRKGILPVSYVDIISDLGDTGSGGNSWPHDLIFDIKYIPRYVYSITQTSRSTCSPLHLEERHHGVLLLRAHVREAEDHGDGWICQPILHPLQTRILHV